MHRLLTVFRYSEMAKSTAIIRPIASLLTHRLKLFSTFQTLDLERHDLPSQLHTLLSCPNWRKEPSLADLSPSITPCHVSSLFNLNGIDPKVALGFFNWIQSERPEFKHTVQSHLSLLSILIRDVHLLRVAENIRISMIRSCVSANDIKFALDGLRKLNKDGELNFKLSLACYNTILISLAKFLMIDEMKNVYSEILEDGIAPSIDTLNAMIYGFCKIGNVVEAEFYLNKLLQAGFRPDTFTFECFISGRHMNLDVDGAQKNEVSYTPTLSTLCGGEENSYDPYVDAFTLFIVNLCKENKLDEARRILDDMSRKELVPSLVTCNALVEGYCKKGLIKDAFQLLDLMESKSPCHRNVLTYVALIDILCGENKLNEAKMVFNEMSKKGLDPNFAAYNSLMEGYCKSGLLSHAFEFLELMESQNFYPDVWVYHGLIGSFYNRKCLYKVVALVIRVLKLDSLPGIDLMNNLMYDLCEAKDWHDALMLFDSMIEHKLLPSSDNVNNLIYGLCKDAKMKEALLLVKNMVKMGEVPRVIIFEILFPEMLQQRDVGHAFQLLKLIESINCCPDAEMYNDIYDELVTGFYEMGKGGKAVKLLNKMLDLKLSPSSFNVNKLLFELCKDREIKQASLFVEKMVKNGERLTVVTFTILIQEMLKQGASDDVFRMYNQMISLGHQPTPYIASLMESRRLQESL